MSADCSALESRANELNEILLEWNELDSIGFFASYYFTLLSLWIPLMLFLVSSCFIPYSIFNVWWPSHDRRQKEIWLTNTHTAPRSTVFQVLRPYFGGNDDALIYTILDFANITVDCDEVETYYLYSGTKHIIDDEEIGDMRECCICMLACLAIPYCYIFLASICIHYQNEIFTMVEVYEDYDATHHMVEQSSMTQVCDASTLNIAHYQFVFEPHHGSNRPYYLHRSDISIATASAAGSSHGTILLPGITLLFFTLPIFYMCLHFGSKLCNAQRGLNEQVDASEK